MTADYLSIGIAGLGLIGASIPAVSLFVSKESTVTNQRQKWLEELRYDLSSFLAIARTLSVRGERAGDVDRFIQEEAKALEELYRLCHRIVLRLNPKEGSHLRLQKLVRVIANGCADSSSWDDVCDSALSEIDDAGQRVFKETWDKVKRGEATFRWFRNGVVSLIVIAFFILVVSIGKSFAQEGDSSSEASGVSSGIEDC